MTIIHSILGNLVSITLSVYNDGELEDSITVPIVKSLYIPNMTESTSYPQDMQKLATGTYELSIDIPNSPSSVGNFIADIEYTHPNGNVLNETYQIIARRSNGLAGNYFVIPASS